jgi:hypothetical protein
MIRVAKGNLWNDLEGTNMICAFCLSNARTGSMIHLDIRGRFSKILQESEYSPFYLDICELRTVDELNTLGSDGKNLHAIS